MTVRPVTRDFRKLKIWERAHRLTLDVYRVTAVFPRDEQFGLTSQIRRSAASVPANIAEGCGRGGGDLARFCRIAAGSLSELQYHLILAHDLRLLGWDIYSPLSDQASELERMMTSFIMALQKPSDKDEQSIQV